MAFVPIYRLMANEIIADIRAGFIAPGEPIPSVRGLLREGYRGRCSGVAYAPVAIGTGQRVHDTVKASGLVATPEPNPGATVSGRRTRVLPREAWPV